MKSRSLHLNIPVGLFAQTPELNYHERIGSEYILKVRSGGPISITIHSETASGYTEAPSRNLGDARARVWSLCLVRR